MCCIPCDARLLHTATRWPPTPCRWLGLETMTRPMSTGDFDLDSLAAYLHLTPDKVRRMVDRGRLPGRKIGGIWRFSEAEIHHWLEDSIGASDDTELERVEGVLRRAEPGAQDISIAACPPAGGHRRAADRTYAHVGHRQDGGNGRQDRLAVGSR